MDAVVSAEWLPWVYSVGLLFLGLILILLEVFVVPGMNIFGILGFGTVCVGVWFAWLRLGPAVAAAIGVVGLVGTAVLVWVLVRSHAWQRLVRTDRTDRASGFDSSTGELADLAGAVGTALTTLRPSGRARFGERIVDVVTDGGFISLGSAVEVIAVHGNRVVVHERADA